MTNPETDCRIAAAHKILAESGLPRATVREAGHEREVAMISAPGDRWDALLQPEAVETVRHIKALGYRHVAIDMEPRPSSG